MIKVILDWGEGGYESAALSAFSSLSGLPGFQICQDPGCYFQIRPEIKDGKTILTWEFGIIGNRVVSSGHFEGCILKYRIQSFGSLGGYSQTVYGDTSELYDTLQEAIDAVKTRQKEDNERALVKALSWGEDFQDTPEHWTRVREQAGSAQPLGITPVLCIE